MRAGEGPAPDLRGLATAAPFPSALPPALAWPRSRRRGSHPRRHHLEPLSHLFSPLLPTCRQSRGFSRIIRLLCPTASPQCSECPCRSPRLHSVPSVSPSMSHCPGMTVPPADPAVSSQHLSTAVAWPGLSAPAPRPPLPDGPDPRGAFLDATLAPLQACCAHTPPRPRLPALTPTHSSSTALPLLGLAGPLGAGTGWLTAPPEITCHFSTEAPFPRSSSTQALAAGQPRALSGFGTGAPDVDPVPE